MLDEKSIDLKLENLKDEILQASAHNMRVILESSVDKKQQPRGCSGGRDHHAPLRRQKTHP